MLPYASVAVDLTSSSSVINAISNDGSLALDYNHWVVQEEEGAEDGLSSENEMDGHTSPAIC